jgi:hypothetical protein
MSIRMGLFAVMATLLLGGLSMAQPASAQELAGTWQGKLQVDPKTAMTIQFVFAKKPDGSYSAVLNSPDNDAIKNLAADSVAVKAGAVSVKVAALSGEFDGTLNAGSLSGQWKQPGSTLPLALTPYQKPVMSKAAVDTLTGTWTGPLTTPGGTLTFVAKFQLDSKGEMQGSLSVPEQGATLPMRSVEFGDGKLTFKIAAPINGTYEATLTNGALNGLWRQGGQPPAGLPVVLKKGEYVAKVVVLKMPTEAFGKVAGTWKGELHATGPQGAVTLPIVLRFETNQRADMVAFMDSPSQHSTGIPVTAVSLTDGKLVVKVDTLHGEYDATLSGNTLTGQWMQGPQTLPLTMTRK